MKYLFKPGKIGKLEIKNRIVMAPMGTMGLVEMDGRYSQRAIDYFVARAKGGVGLIETGLMAVEAEIEKRAAGPWSGLPRTDSPAYICRLNELADAVHAYEAKIVAQLTAGYGRVGKGAILAGGWAVAPSPQPCFWDPAKSARGLTVEEIEKLVKAFGPASLNVKLAGFDGVELHGHEGYLMDQFMTAKWNKRTDKYGGTFEKRLRFSLEVIENIRKSVGPDFPIIYRLSAHHALEGGRRLEESIAIAKRFEEAGVDCLHIDVGCYDAWHWAHPPIYMPKAPVLKEVSAIKNEVSVPVIAVGRLGDPKVAERILADGKADFIALGRPLLADPEWPLKVKEGRISDIRPCIGDHDGCLGRIAFEGKYLSCTVNPQTGMERELAIQPALRRKSILIIGGGPGGMEAARVAALRGHKVKLWEKSGALGGNLIPAGVPDFKTDIRSLVAYLSNQLKKLGVQVRLNKEATAASVKAAKVDEVIVATGTQPIVLKIPGMNRKNVVQGIDLFTNGRKIGKKIVVVGGGVVGCEVALWLSRQGKEVTVIEMLKSLVNDIFPANRQNLLELLRQANVATLTESEICEITDRGIVFQCSKGRKEMAADTVVMAAGLKAENTLFHQLRDLGISVHAVGDCVAARRIQSAIWEAYRLALTI